MSLNLYFVILVSTPVPIIGYEEWNISFSFLGPRKQISEHYLDKTMKYSFQIVPNSSSVSQCNFTSYYLLTNIEFFLHNPQQLPSSQQWVVLGFNYENLGLS